MKIISLILFIIFVGFAVLQLNDAAWLPWCLAYLLSAYTSACSFKNYYNPMLLMLMVTAYLIAAIGFFPAGLLQDFQMEEGNSGKDFLRQVLWGELHESTGLLICSVINSWYMFIGFGKAKKPGYNAAFSVSLRNR